MTLLQIQSWINKLTNKDLVNTQADEIKKLNIHNLDIESQLALCKSQKLLSDTEVFELSEEIDDLKTQLEYYKVEEGICPIPNMPVDFDMHPYFPASKFWYFNKETKGIVQVNVQYTPSKLTRIWTDEMYNYVIGKFLSVKDKTLKEQLIFLRNLVLSKCKYQFDYDSKGITTENWKTPVETYYSGVGDCEDLTNLWLTFCNICGIPANQVFNLTGVYVNSNDTETGHSFGAFIDDNKLYIMECTSMSSPVRFVGSRYKCKGTLNGLSNWKYSGVPKQEQW